MATPTRRTIAVLLVAAAALVGAGSGRDAEGTASASGTQRSGERASSRSRHELAARYLAIAVAGNRRLEKDYDPFEGRDRHNLARSKADLLDAAATERLFDRRLLGIPFPPSIERVARELARVNEVRARLTTGASAATSLSLLNSYRPTLDGANIRVERLVARIRRQLGLPPPNAS